MSPIQLKRRLEKLTDQEALMSAINKWLNKNPEMVLFYQRQQLFKKSIDSDGNPLGFYKTDRKGVKKKAGNPFTMVTSGLFKKNLFYRDGKITSKVPYLSEMKKNPAFLSTKFFGLTEDSYRRFYNSKLKPFIHAWMQNILEGG